VEKAGAKVEDIPKTWDVRYDFFKGLQKKLREQGMRNIFGVGFTVSSVGVDTNNQLNQFVIGYGGGNLVDKDDRLHLDDPAAREAVIGALRAAGAINWNDSDNNNVSVSWR
jgi:multiple sugar transport system substrate-binding protein